MAVDELVLQHHEGAHLEDSLLATFELAEEPDDANTLYKSQVRFEDFEGTTYTLGWKSEPKHHGDYKRPDDIDQVAALVEVREGRFIGLIGKWSSFRQQKLSSLDC